VAIDDQPVLAEVINRKVIVDDDRSLLSRSGSQPASGR